MPALDDGLAETEIPAGQAAETDVLIGGSGPPGGAAALCLASLPVPSTMITKYRWTTNIAGAHHQSAGDGDLPRLRHRGSGQGRRDAARARRRNGVLHVHRGEAIGRIRTWGMHPAREADYQLANPCLVYDIPQTYLEPILVKNAAACGTQARFSTEYLSHTQDEEGVTTTVRDRLIGLPYEGRWTSRAR